MKNKEETEDNLDVSKAKSYDKSGIRTHAPFETRKLLLVVELRYTLTWRLGPTRPSYQLWGQISLAKICVVHLPGGMLLTSV